ncbi:uncharacterized protein LOC123216992 isoform X3 [Mangifera indica]|uniref:uncharacterized protein LOC123216992 isoform X3 n=1 Tax=Mangifera indica TaxID=29780 RepID=UPI001CF9FC40|nr:uncharacterized protein LOC123216992 isoform X3 [Mangifera indica]
MEGKIFFYLLHCILRGSASNVDVLGIAEVQELPAFGCIDIPRTLYEVIAQLANRLAQWDDKFWRLFLTSIIGAADEVKLKFMTRCFLAYWPISYALLKKVSVLPESFLFSGKEIVFELLQHVRGNIPRALLDGVRKSTRE